MDLGEILSAVIRFSFFLIFRSRILWGILAGLVFMLVFSWAGFTFSGRQPQTVALDLGLSFARFFSAVFGVLLTQELIAKEVERRYFFTSLTYPCSRSIFLFGRFVAAYLLTLAVLFVMLLALAAAVYLFGFEYGQKSPVNVGGALLILSAFYAVDLFVVLAFSTALAVVASVPGLVLILSVGFIVIARSWSTVLRLLHDEGSRAIFTEQYREGFSWLRYVLPDLGGLDVRAISLYDNLSLMPSGIGEILMGAMAYGIFFLAIAGLRFEHRQFN